MEKYLLLCLFALAFASASSGSLDLTGLNYGNCAQECNPSILLRSLDLYTYQCLPGFECRSNGCGHTCQKVRDVAVEKRGCSPVYCRLYCPNGWAIGEDGCPYCQCKEL